MTDNELIDYTELHSKTQRALFHIDHINRMLELAGDTTFCGNDFYTWRYPEAKPVIEKAKLNLKENN